MNITTYLAAVAAGGLALAASAMDVVLKPDGTIRIGERLLKPAVIQLGWRVAPVKGEMEFSRPGTAQLRIAGDDADFMNATVSLCQLDGGKVRIGYEFSVLKDVELETICCSLSLPLDEVTGLKWRAGKASGTLSQPKNEGTHIASGTLRSVELPLAKSGEMVRFATTNKVSYLIQDSRRWTSEYTVRIGDRHRRKYEKGTRVSFALEVSSNEPLNAVDQQPYVIKAGDEWIPLDYRRDILAGSALDFSGMGFTDAPAGKYGWTKNVGGHFEFEGRPGRPQRFYGVNLTGGANFPDHGTADIMVTRFRRLGYNTIRVHHHDAGTVAGSTDSLTLNPANMDRLDYFVAAAIREGLYVTTDIFVSRSSIIKWRHIGVDRDGCVGMQLFKALCAVYDPALENWMAYARNFLMHLNPYTGRRYIDEPAIPLISLVNEGGFFMGWDRGVSEDPRVVASWKAWLEAKRASNPDFAPGVSADRLPKNFWSPKSYSAIAQWTGELEARMVSRMKAFLRELGCKALITDGNCGPHYAALQMATVDYDYIDDHFYVDHPSFLEKRWHLPSRCSNKNPIIGKGRVAPCSKAYTRMFGKPFTISEWNFAGPGRYRGVGGILTGAMAALQDWDGLWRYTYSHTCEGILDADQSAPGYFDVARDPLFQASERACMCLFLRGDIEPLSDGVALWVTRKSVDWTKVLPGAPEWSGAAWRMRTGSCLTEESARGMRVIRREDAEGADAIAAVEAATAKSRSPITFDHVRGTFTIDTPRTCGGFVPKGVIDAGNLKAEVTGAPATVWVHSLDASPIPRSERLLLTHLTDVQGDGVKFQDETMRVLFKWGSRPLVQKGSAEISLRLDNPERYTVHELATNGRRVREIPTTAEDGRLRFTASIAGPDGARILYEIAKEPLRLPGEDGKIAALPPDPFPDRLSAYVWRNWGLVDPALLAETVGATKAQLSSIAEEMGLVRDPVVLPEWKTKGYITVLRRNWHLLPYGQILKILGKTREEMFFCLMEDDFLWVKLGKIKPFCEPLLYTEDAAAYGRQARRRIAAMLREEGLDPAAPEEARFSFIRDIASVAKWTSAGVAPDQSPFGFRLIFSYFADYGDPLGDSAVSSYPDGLLQKLAAEGVNAVWLHTVLRTLAKDPKYPEFGEGSGRRIENLRTLVARAAKYGIRVFLYMNEPRAMPAAFFEANGERQGFKGASHGELFAMCTSSPEVRRWVRDSLKQVFSQVPGLGGIFTITMSENLTNCASKRHRETCPRCKDRPVGEIVAEINRTMVEGMTAGNPKAEALIWNWQWPKDEEGAIVAALPSKNCRIMAVSENAMKIRRGGVDEVENDYSISVVGPGENARRMWSLAKSRGIPCVAKVQAANSWELSPFPYIPVMDLVAQHAVNLANEGVDGVMLSWSLGCCPSPNLRVYRELRKGETSKDGVLERMAAELYGAKARDARRAWTAFSCGFTNYPFSCKTLYDGPQQWGPANPLYARKTGWNATMVGIPYDDLDSWRARYPRETYAMLIGRVADGFDEGCRIMEGVASRKELDMFRAEQMHFASCRDQALFVMARDSGDRNRMVALAKAELERAKKYWTLVRADSRIGYESSNHYFFIPRDVLEKVLSCRKAMGEYGIIQSVYGE